MPKDGQKNLVDIQVITGAGNYPDSGFQHYNLQEKLEIILHQAANHLKLQNTDAWVAKIGGRQLNPALSLEANQIQDDSKIFWAPTERGGGFGDVCIRK